jgi:hypothetical protein
MPGNGLFIDGGLSSYSVVVTKFHHNILAIPSPSGRALASYNSVITVSQPVVRVRFRPHIEKLERGALTRHLTLATLLLSCVKCEVWLERSLLISAIAPV